MKWSKLSVVAIWLLFVLAAPGGGGPYLATGWTPAPAASPPAKPPEITRFSLENGIRVVILHFPDSRNISIISCLPLGFASDGAGQAQWSHLLEHMTLRTTGPIANYRERNGETMPDLMHLDFMGDAADWEKGLDLHARWLSGLPFPEEVLREEAARAVAEVDATAARLATHKWAVAAWNQVCRHGRSHAAVRRDLVEAEKDVLELYRDRYLVRPERTVICIAGGVGPSVLKPYLSNRFSDIGEKGKGTPPAAPDRMAATGSRGRATWDLEARHYMEAYAIPGPGHEDHAALAVAARLLLASLYTDQELKGRTSFTLCGTDLVSPESSFLYVSAPLKPGASPDDVAARVRHHLETISRGASAALISMAASGFSRELSAPGDPEQAQKNLRVSIDRGMIEGNIALQWGLSEYRYGSGLAGMAEAVGKVSGSDLAAVVAKYLTPEKRISLILVPEK